MSDLAEVQDLASALHRKLKNYGQDIRNASRQPRSSRDETLLKSLKSRRTAVDKAYSACVSNLKETDPVKRADAYRVHLSQYQQL